MDKSKLDNILEKHKSQPVGNGYIDIIVSRDNYKSLISDLVVNGFNINGISWWEWCEDNNEEEYGLGGPVSIFYQGWFSELPIDFDSLTFSENMTNENKINYKFY